MGFGFGMKKCHNCGSDFVAYKDRVYYCDKYYIEEYKPCDLD